MASSVNPSTQREINLVAAQTEVPKQAPTCPICHKTDQVRTLQAAFDLGTERIAPPAMPTSNARMMPWIVAGFFIYLAGNFYLFIELAANSQNRWPMVVQILSFVINLLALLVGLVLSYMAILRIARGDRALPDLGSRDGQLEPPVLLPAGQGDNRSTAGASALGC